MIARYGVGLASPDGMRIRGSLALLALSFVGCVADPTAPPGAVSDAAAVTPEGGDATASPDGGCPASQGAAGSCEEAPIACVCRAPCPATLDAFRAAHPASACNAHWAETVAYPNGKTVGRAMTTMGLYELTYDTATGALVGARRSDDMSCSRSGALADSSWTGGVCAALCGADPGPGLYARPTCVAERDAAAE